MNAASPERLEDVAAVQRRIEARLESVELAPGSDWMPALLGLAESIAKWEPPGTKGEGW